jgi:hypothetical protein
MDVGEASEPSGELDEASPTPGLGAAEVPIRGVLSIGSDRDRAL